MAKGPKSDLAVRASVHRQCDARLVAESTQEQGWVSGQVPRSHFCVPLLPIFPAFPDGQFLPPAVVLPPAGAITLRRLFACTWRTTWLRHLEACGRVFGPRAAKSPEAADQAVSASCCWATMVRQPVHCRWRPGPPSAPPAVNAGRAAVAARGSNVWHRRWGPVGWRRC